MQPNVTTVDMLVKGIWETIYTVFLPFVLFYVIGIPLGTTLVVTDREGISLVPLLNRVLGLIINPLRSVPFVTLLIMVLSTTKLIVGKTIGSNAMAVSLIIAAAPYTGHMAESSLKGVDAGVIEAAKSMDASTWQITVRVLLPEVKPSLSVGAAISVATILGYFAMAGFTGGGGLGDIAIRYGYHRYQTDMMTVAVVLLAIIVQLIQEVAMRMSRKSDKRTRQKDSGTQPGEGVREQNPGNPATGSRKRAP